MMRSAYGWAWLLGATLWVVGCGSSADSNNGVNGAADAGRSDGSAPPDAGPVEPFPTPAWADEAVVYEVFVRQFSEAGTFDAVTSSVAELQALGVNTLWLMPFQPIGEARRKGTLGSPYSIRDYTGIDPAAGTEEDFRELVEEVHARGMHIIIDWVANHSAFDNPWALEHPEWYLKDEQGNLRHPVGTDWTDVADLTYEVPAQRQAMLDAMRYWVEEMDVDGFRCDVAGLVPSDFWQSAIAELRTIKPIVMLAENASASAHDDGFDWSYPWPEFTAHHDLFNGAPVEEWIGVVEQHLSALGPDAHRIRYTTNHDETAWKGTPPEMFAGLAGAEAAFVLVASLPGIPLLYNGQEVGSDVRTPLFEKEPIDFDQNPEVRAFYQRFLEVRAQSAALRHGELAFLAPEARDVVILERATDAERVIVIVNARRQTRRVTLPAELAGQTFRDLMTGETVELPPEELTLASQAYFVLAPQ